MRFTINHNQTVVMHYAKLILIAGYSGAGGGGIIPYFT